MEKKNPQVKKEKIDDAIVELFDLLAKLDHKDKVIALTTKKTLSTM